MILVDTSVWVDHFRHRLDSLVRLLADEQVLMHPFVMGELSLSGLTRRKEILPLLSTLPPAMAATHDDVLQAVAGHHLDGRGIGWIDAHLFASALLSKAQLWTVDQRLNAVCVDAGITFKTQV